MTYSLVVNTFTGYVINVIAGSLTLPGCTCLPRTEETRHVTIGWSLVDGTFVDTRSSYDPARRWERAS